ncbi:MAG: glycosyltransferase [Balneolaceae bacterium]|nr:glycosyltransferase [Balneolaceae bacterium]
MAKKILIISPVPVFPWHAGNRMRIKNICYALMNHGYELDFFYIGFEKQLSDNHQEFFNGRIIDHAIDDSTFELGKDPFLRIREVQNGLKIKADYLQRKFLDGNNSANFNKSLNEFKNIKKYRLLKQQLSGRSYSAVLLNYAVYSHLFDLFSDDVVKIIDTHDRLSNRYKLFLDEGLEPVVWKSISPADEKKSLSKADVILAITQKEADYFRSLTKKAGLNILTVPHFSPYSDVPVSDGHNRQTILTVGGKSVINLNGLNWFLENVWSKIAESFKQAELYVAGSICDESSKFNTKKSVTLLGRFDKPQEVYHTTDLCVNPIQFGTGLKIKTIEALSSGKKILTTTEGAAGLERFIGKGLICSDSAEVWINEIKAHFLDDSGNTVFKNDLKDEVDQYNTDALSNILKAVNKTESSLS